MTIEHVLAVVPVADFDAAHAWYERLFGRPADNLPIGRSPVEWRLTEVVGPSHLRRRPCLLNFAVKDLDNHVADISARGLATGVIETVNKGVKLSAIPRSRWQHDHFHRELPHQLLSHPLLDTQSDRFRGAGLGPLGRRPSRRTCTG